MSGVTLIVCPIRTASECPAPIAGDYSRPALISGFVSDPLKAIVVKTGSENVTSIAYNSIIHTKLGKIVEKKLRTQIFYV